MKLESTMLQAVTLPGESKYGALVGLGKDILMHHVPLPEDPQAWAGIKGKVTRSAAKVRAHVARDGALAVCRSGKLLATASADGHVAAHAPAAAEEAVFETLPGPAAALHDVTTGGAAAVSFDLSGRWIVSAGPGGAMFLFDVPGSLHTSFDHPAMAPVPATPIDLDAFDEPGELTEAELHKKHMNEAAPVAPTHVADTGMISSRLDEIRAHLMEVRGTSQDDK